MNSADFRFGIVGTGSIAQRFARDVGGHARLRAVASRTAASAESFARRHGVETSHSSLGSMLEDEQVQAIYVASPAHMHVEHCLDAISAHKAVLCEKPIALTAHDAQTITEAAAAEGVFFMEAMWMRCNPLVHELAEIVASAELGDVVAVHVELGFPHPLDRSGRVFDRGAGGGALLDLGVYAVSLAHLLFGPPLSVTSSADLGPTGVDETVVAALRYPAFTLSMTCSLTTRLANVAAVSGTRGRAQLGSPFFDPPRLVREPVSPPPVGEPTEGGRRLLRSAIKRARAIPALDDLLSARGSRVSRSVSVGLLNEAEEVMRCVSGGALSSPMMPPAESVAVMATLDQLRDAWPPTG